MELTEKQKNCPYCHASDLLYSTASSVDDAIMSIPWRLAWPAFLNDNILADPEELVHGQPSGASMMVWREGVMEYTVSLCHPEFNPNTKKWTTDSDCMAPHNCPMCGRDLRGEEK